jgi:hypothetical protein
MTERRTSTLMARLDHGNALEIALQRRESIRLLLGQAKAQGFDVRRLRADLRAIEGEVRQLQAIDSIRR